MGWPVTARTMPRAAVMPAMSSRARELAVPKAKLVAGLRVNAPVGWVRQRRLRVAASKAAMLRLSLM